MPKTKRDQLKRNWAQGRNHLYKAALEFEQLKQIFATQHPDYAQLLDLTINEIYVAVQGAEAFCMHAWGKVPESTESWRA